MALYSKISCGGKARLSFWKIGAAQIGFLAESFFFCPIFKKNQMSQVRKAPLTIIPVDPKFRLLTKWLDQILNNNDKNVHRVKDYLQNKQGSLPDRITEARSLAFKHISSIVRHPDHADHGLAQYLMAQCYEKGWGTEKNPAQAFAWAYRGAKNRNPWAMCAYGLYHQMAIGTEKNEEKGARWVMKAAEKNLPHALFNLAVLYEGGIGVEKNWEKSFSLYEKGAKLGSPLAMAGLALCYETGRGTKVDAKKAFEYHLQAANLNDEESMNNIGYSYQIGRGVGMDIEKALFWYIKAEQAGEKECAPYNILALLAEEKFREIYTKLKKQIELENRANEMLPDQLRIMLIGYFKEENCIFYREYIPFEVFHLLLEEAGLIRL